ncbi:centromere protein Q-like [Acanthaster planci]|uniref:Centromere protein Q n=1 Tax=Acanthaster planci TaxID=133434 RepID=A0A8B7YYC5_ACAPL|nr:centromere protein Q-like [Acanthaster planci]
MPRAKTTAKKNDAARGAAATQAKKGPTISGRKPAKKSTANVAGTLEMTSPGSSDSSSQLNPSRQGKRPPGRRQKTGDTAKSSAPAGPGWGEIASKGGSGRARKGWVPDKTDDVPGDSQRDAGEKKGTGVKRSHKMRGKNQGEVPVGSREGSPTKRRRQTGQRKAFGQEDYLERQVSAQSIAKWQTMTKTTQEFLHQIADSAIAVVLSETDRPINNDIQDHLNNLKTRLLKSFASLKVPSRRQPNYKDMEKHTRLLEAALVETSNQVECLEKEVKLQQELLEQKEEELERLEVTDQQDHSDSNSEIAKELHPLLQDTRQEVLGLPHLRRSCRSNTSSQNVRSSCQQQVVETLRHLSQAGSGGTVNATDFIVALSAIQAALPQ